MHVREAGARARSRSRRRAGVGAVAVGEHTRARPCTRAREHPGSDGLAGIAWRLTSCSFSVRASSCADSSCARVACSALAAARAAATSAASRGKGGRGARGCLPRPVQPLNIPSAASTRSNDCFERPPGRSGCAADLRCERLPLPSLRLPRFLPSFRRRPGVAMTAAADLPSVTTARAYTPCASASLSSVAMSGAAPSWSGGMRPLCSSCWRTVSTGSGCIVGGGLEADEPSSSMAQGAAGGRRRVEDATLSHCRCSVRGGFVGGYKIAGWGANCGGRRISRIRPSYFCTIVVGPVSRCVCECVFKAPRTRSWSRLAKKPPTPIALCPAPRGVAATGRCRL